MSLGYLCVMWVACRLHFFTSFFFFHLGRLAVWSSDRLIVWPSSIGWGIESIKRTEETGVLIRSPIGFLVYMGNEEKTASLNLGSRLKTPIVPIWIVIASEQSGVLFGDDKELLRDYQGENRSF